MMRLVELRARRWTICSELEVDGSVPLVEELIAIAGGNHRAAAAGFVALIERCSNEGPYVLPTPLSHDVGDGLRELIKGRFRLLYFVDDGAMIVCSHTFLKKSQKIPRAEVARANRLRERFHLAKRNGELEVVGGEEDVLRAI